MTDYVAGFLFSNDNQRVALIEKRRPAWQAGKLNGIGGHIEANETPLAAMIREFFEETGLRVTSWKHYVTLNGDGFRVFFFYAHTFSFGDIQSMTDEAVNICEIPRLNLLPVIPNLKWLIPMAFSMPYDLAACFDVHEHKAPLSSLIEGLTPPK